MEGKKNVILLFVLFFSCQESGEDRWKGKKIFFPTELRELRGAKLFPVDGFVKSQTQRRRQKVISIIDATCVKCIVNNLNKVDSLFSSLGKDVRKPQIVFILNVDRADSASFMRNLYPLIKTNGMECCCGIQILICLKERMIF